MATISAYELLDLSITASEEIIRSSYYQKAKLYHPDRGGRVEDFLNLKRAFDILSDPKSREKMGAALLFPKPPMRVQPSLLSNLDLLLVNIEAVRDRLANE